MMSNIAVIGSRTIDRYDIIESYLQTRVCDGDVLISGGAVGVDELAQRYAKLHGHKILVIYPNYKKHGYGAPLKRNKEIVDVSDVVIAFWNGTSKGTKQAIDLAKKADKKVLVVSV